MHSGRKDGADLIGLRIEAPKADAHEFERVQCTHGVDACLGWHDDNGLMGEIAITGSLRQRFLPVGEFHLKRPARRLGHLRESGRSWKSLAIHASPSDGQQVGNAITVYGDLQRERKAGLERTPVQRGGLFRIGTDECTGEPILRRDRAGAHGRKVLLGLVEAVFWNRCDSRAHGHGFRFVQRERYMNLMNRASEQMMLARQR